MAAGIGSMNFYYKRYSDTPGISTDQPGFVVDNTDPGNGWSNYRYKNFNADYIRYSDTPGIATTPPAAYERFSDTPGISTTQPAQYQRYDDQDPPQQIPNPVPPIVPNS